MSIDSNQPNQSADWRDKHGPTLLVSASTNIIFTFVLDKLYQLSQRQDPESSHISRWARELLDDYTINNYRRELKDILECSAFTEYSVVSKWSGARVRSGPNRQPYAYVPWFSERLIVTKKMMSGKIGTFTLAQADLYCLLSELCYRLRQLISKIEKDGTTGLDTERLQQLKKIHDSLCKLKKDASDISQQLDKNKQQMADKKTPIVNKSESATNLKVPFKQVTADISYASILNVPPPENNDNIKEPIMSDHSVSYVPSQDVIVDDLDELVPRKVEILDKSETTKSFNKKQRRQKSKKTERDQVPVYSTQNNTDLGLFSANSNVSIIAEVPDTVHQQATAVSNPIQKDAIPGASATQDAVETPNSESGKRDKFENAELIKALMLTMVDGKPQMTSVIMKKEEYDKIQFYTAT